MIALCALLIAGGTAEVEIRTARGAVRIPVREEHGPALAASDLAPALGLSVVVEGARATVVLDGAGFVFTLGTPWVRVGRGVYQLAGESYVARDTLFLPLAWLADCVPRVFGGRFIWDPEAGRFSSAAADSAARAAPATPAPAPVAAAPVARTPESPPNPLTGLRRRHLIVIDPGHGGIDPGNPGRYFPKGVKEKDVNLTIGRLLRAELDRRGIGARLTRTTDTLIDLHDRPGFCRDDCDLFVSIHVNSMPAGRRSRVASGVETYFLSDAKTEDQRRVAAMENDAIRFETPDAQDVDGDLGVLIRDLQQNEYLRESARLAALVQTRLASVHPGEDRGVQQAGLYVLNRAQRPAILVETGFATNPEDGDFLTSALGQRRIANAIADGIVAYLLEFERRVAGAGSGR